MPEGTNCDRFSHEDHPATAGGKAVGMGRTGWAGIALTIVCCGWQASVAASELWAEPNRPDAPPTFELVQYRWPLPYPSPYRTRRWRWRSLPPAVPSNATQNCADLTAMAQLAYTLEPESRLSREIVGGRAIACGSQANSGDLSFRWSTGEPARFGDRWYYPSGLPARFGDGWNYPNGRTAKQGDSWNYPNGQSARFGPYWYTPNGETVSEQELIVRICRELESQICSDRLGAMQNAPRFWYELTLVQLAWLAAQDGL